MQWDIELQTDPHDLSDDWPLVIDEPKEVQDDFMVKFRQHEINPVEFGRMMGIPILPLGVYREVHREELITAPGQ